MKVLSPFNIIEAMENEIKLKPQTIIARKFTRDVKGYNPDEVDEFLDIVIQDYRAFERFTIAASTRIAQLKEKIDSLEKSGPTPQTDIDALKSKIRTLEAENASLKEKYKYIKPGDHVTSDNLDLINRKNCYEEFLLSKGVNPDEVYRRKPK